MTLLVGETRIRLSDPGPLVARLCAHLAGFDARVSAADGETRLALPFGTATLRAGPGVLALRAEAPAPEALAVLKNLLIGHLETFTGAEGLDVVWTGDGAGPQPLPNFRAMRVAGAEWVTPWMRRLRLAGPDLARFDVPEMHVKLLIPPPGTPLAVPVLGASGRPVWPADLPRPAMRTYTLRRIDAAAGWVEVDFAIHDDISPGAHFALTARPGDAVGLIGPGGGLAPEAGWTLFAGDETALPAIARMLERMQASARGLALIEIADRTEEQDLPRPAGVDLRWLHRDGAAPGESPLLRQAAFDALRAAGEADVFAWAGCEYDTLRTLQRRWRGPWGLDRTPHFAVPYWRRGAPEGAARTP